MKYGTLVRLNHPDDSEKEFKKLRLLGLDSCQLVYKPTVYNVQDADIIKRAASKNGVEISAFFAGFGDDYTLWELKYDFINAGLNSEIFGAKRLEYILSAIPFVNALGVTDIIVHAGFIPNNPFAPEYARMLGMIRLLAMRAAENDCNILLETGGESPITLLRLIRELDVNNIFINLDTGNIIMYGYGNPCEAIMTFGKYIRNIHAKDGLPPSDPYKLGEETEIGQGVVDFKRVFLLLRELGYNRFVTIEREITGEKQIEDIKNGIRYLKKIISKIY